MGDRWQWPGEEVATKKIVISILTEARKKEKLVALSLESEAEKIFCVLSMGAGSMMISHANDAYFWIITKFSGLQMNAILKVYSTATIIMGLVSFAMTYLISLLILKD